MKSLKLSEALQNALFDAIYATDRCITVVDEGTCVAVEWGPWTVLGKQENRREFESQADAADFLRSMT